MRSTPAPGPKNGQQHPGPTEEALAPAFNSVLTRAGERARRTGRGISHYGYLVLAEPSMAVGRTMRISGLADFV